MHSFSSLSEELRKTFSPRLVAALLFALLSCVATANANTAPTQGASLIVADAGFGSVPSGEYPILFNDHTVYAKPDVLKRGRVLAALVKGDQIYVPLRSIFEQMGATVSASSDGKVITAVKNGASVSITLGKSEVVVDGETRPLDVPPMLYKGVVLVPVRVMSEALGAYVQWVPDRRIVVVRYVSPPSATPAPTAAPVLVPPIPAPTPTATPAQRSYQGFIAAALLAPRTYTEFSAGQFCLESYLLSAGYAFKNSPFAVKIDYREESYVTSDNLTDSIGNHYTRFATIDGGTAFTPVFKARQSSLDARLEYQVAAPRFYVGLSYLHLANNYGYPNLDAVGAGLEKLPDLRSGFNLYGSAFYYPTASGSYTLTDPASSNVRTTYRQQYSIVKYDLGVALAFARFPVYVFGGYAGERYKAKQNAPIGQTHDGPYAGLGVRL